MSDYTHRSVKCQRTTVRKGLIPADRPSICPSVKCPKSRFLRYLNFQKSIPFQKKRADRNNNSILNHPGKIVNFFGEDFDINFTFLSPFRAGMAKFSLSGLPDLSTEKSPKRAHLASFSEKSPIKPPNLLGFSNVSRRFRLSGGGRFILSTGKNERFAKNICPRSARNALAE